jgi:hypothetical protein
MGELRQAFVESFKQALPLEVLVPSFKEGLTLFFSPFIGFWRAVSAAISPRSARRDDTHQLFGAE